MILFLVNPTYRDVFRVLHRLKGKRELQALLLDGGQEYQKDGLLTKRGSYFALLRGNRKTLKDLILAGALREYPFSRAIRQGFFVPKLKGDVLYYAYLSRGWGESLHVEGIEEFEGKVRKLKERENFIDYWEVEEVKIPEPVVVLFNADQYKPIMLSPLFDLMRKDKKKDANFGLKA